MALRGSAQWRNRGREVRLTTVPEDIAHELRQPLTAILSNAQAAQRLLAAGGPDLAEVPEILADIIASARRAAGMLQQLEDVLKNRPAGI